MTDLTETQKPTQLVLSDSLPEELERLLRIPNIDWTGHMVGNSTMHSKPVPVLDKNSKSYVLLLIAIRKLEISLYPARPRDILQLLAKLRLHYASSHMSEKELSLLLEDYLNDLAIYPRDILEQACIAYRKSSENLFFPKISQLIKFMNELWYPRKAKLNKLRKLLEVSNQQKESK